MKRSNRINGKRILSWAGFLVLCLGLTGETCTEERNIDVVVGAEVIAGFEARGILNNFDDQVTVNVATDADIRQILDDNGFEGKVIANIEAAFVKVIKRDQNAANRTVTGSVTVAPAGGGTPAPLITNASEAVNDESLADWKPVPLQAAGVDLINQALLNYLTDIFNGVPNPREPNLTFAITGVCTPQNIQTDFDWQVKVRLTLVGKKEVTVVDPI